MGGVSTLSLGLHLIFLLFLKRSAAAATNLDKTCKYECEETGGCTVKYTGPSRSGDTIGSCFSDFFGGGCSGTPLECLDCNEAIQCERNSSLSRIGTVLTHHEQQNRNQPPSESFQCPIDPGTPDEDCTPETPCSIGEGPCTERDTCEDGLRCGTKNCGNFPGNTNVEANCCYDPYRPGDGDQFVFDVFTVLGQQMERTLVWLDEADEETTVTCCGENAGEERKKCGGPNAPSCKTICGAVTRFQLAYDNFDNTQCSADLFLRDTNIWKIDDVCPTPKSPYGYVPESKSLPSHIREKRMTNQKDCKNRGRGRGKKVGCTTTNTHASIDFGFCKDKKLYDTENIQKPRRNLLCCLDPNFRVNAGNQITRAPGIAGRKFRSLKKANIRNTGKVCCNQYGDTARGVDALRNIGCSYASLR